VHAGDDDEDAQQGAGQYLGRAVEVLRHVQEPAPSLGIAVSTQYPEQPGSKMPGVYRLGGGALNETDVCGGMCDDRCSQSHAGSRVRVSLVG
jgi:hypothetical protein